MVTVARFERMPDQTAAAALSPHDTAELIRELASKPRDWMTNRTWRKSSYGGAEGNECVELAVSIHDTAVRDTKNPDGGTLRFSSTAFRAFLTAARTDTPT